jgi:hypothetical protein
MTVQISFYDVSGTGGDKRQFFSQQRRNSGC